VPPMPHAWLSARSRTTRTVPDQPTNVLQTIEAVRRACREADRQDPLDEAASLQLNHRGLADVTTWLSGTDGFALRRGSEVDLAVSPAARGRGVGRGLARDAVAGDVPTIAWSHGDHPAAARLAESHGLVRARELWVMRRSAAQPLPELDLPDDLSVRGYRAADADDVLAVNAAAFAAHPEQGGMDSESLAERMAEPWFDPRGLLVAVDETSTMLGFHWTKQHDAALGEVYVVGVGPTAQGRGLGRLLTLAGLHHLGSRGVREIILYVEANNEPAIHVYTGLGFVHAAADTHVQYRR